MYNKDSFWEQGALTGVYIALGFICVIALFLTVRGVAMLIVALPHAWLVTK